MTAFDHGRATAAARHKMFRRKVRSWDLTVSRYEPPCVSLRTSDGDTALLRARHLGRVSADRTCSACFVVCEALAMLPLGTQSISFVDDTVAVVHTGATIFLLSFPGRFFNRINGG